MLRAGLKKILEDEFADATIGEAGSVDEAANRLHDSAWDVLLLDISLPAAAGSFAPRRARLIPDTKVIVLSSFGDQQFAVRSLRTGAAAFLTRSAPRRS